MYDAARGLANRLRFMRGRNADITDILKALSDLVTCLSDLADCVSDLDSKVSRLKNR